MSLDFRPNCKCGHADEDHSYVDDAETENLKCDYCNCEEYIEVEE